MGRCLAFNFGPKELKEKMKGIKYFVYCPDFDGFAGGFDQYFYTVLSIVSRDVAGFKQELVRALNLTAEGDEYVYSPSLMVQFVGPTENDELFLKLKSRERYGAITDRQIADLRLVDEQLSRMGLMLYSLPRHQDVVFGENHLLASTLSEPFINRSGVGIPLQDYWFVGKSFEEAAEKFQKWSRGE